MFKPAESIFLVQFLEYLSEQYLLVQCLNHRDQMGDNPREFINFGGCHPYCYTTCKLSFKRSKKKQPITDLVHTTK